ncbi:hypothetical protein E4U39_005413 [Claviceps sp. Clav50 group G5]|nr:hypothetical protein E4U39_005413 [Claviceps sp. Clav50 group G5]
MPPITPHGTKECNRCHATKTLDAFIDRRAAFGVIRKTVIAASPTLRQRGPILPAQCGLDPDDVFGPTSAQSREFFVPSARSGQYCSTTVCDESEVETDIIPPSARSSQYRSATVSGESEVETNTITPSAPSAHPSQYRSATVSDESVESSDAPDTPCASVNHTGYHLMLPSGIG